MKHHYPVRALSLLCALAIFVSLIPAVSAAVSPNVLENNTITDTVTPAGVQLNLFDYWVTERTAVDKSIQLTDATGINTGHDLRFMAIGDGTNDNEIRINKYTGQNGGVRSGIVQDRLSGGYPMLTPGNKTGLNENGGLSRPQSLAYLFDKSEETETNGVKGGTLGKKTFWDVRGLLQVDDHGYYYFNADNHKAGNGNPYQSANYAYFNETGEKAGSFTVYNTYGIKKAGYGDQQGQFFPFNSPSSLDIFTENNGKLVPNMGIDSQNPAINHLFGLSMITRFVQRYGGMTTERGNEAMTFQFAGDDDVWIFIDGVLVADLGGIHDQASTTIDFSDGQITINGNDAGTLKSKMEPYYNDKTGYPDYWSGTTFADNTYHTLKLFYLERGGTDSNLAMKFNLAYVPETDGIKVDQNGTLLPGVQFDLYAAQREEKTDSTYKYTKTSEDPIGSGTTDEDGRFVLTNADDIAVSLNDLNKRGIQYLILEERNENRTGYRHDDSIYLVLQSNDADTDTVLLNDENHRWTTGTYAALKGSVATSPDITLSDTNETINLDNADGKLFAVIMRRMNNVGQSKPSTADEWGVVTGSALSGWQVTGRESGGSYIPAVIEALQNDAVANGNAVVFTPAANGSYMAELKNCPGDLRNYYYWSNNVDTAYNVAFYYTEESDLSRATEKNTHWVDGAGFERQFAATIYIPNVQHHLYVKKVDDSAAQKPLSGAVFDLYTAESLTVTDGAYGINSNAEPYDTVTTGADGLATFPSTEKKLLAAGKYYLVERTAPAGHTVNPTPIPVIVDDTHGVMADAGTANDGVAVTVAEGHLVPTMTPFATVDDIDRTLTNITTTRMEAESGWNPTLEEAAPKQIVDLRLNTESFKKDHPVQTLRYIPVNEENKSLSWRTETGWLWFHIEQTPIAGSDPDKNLKTDLGNRDLTRLFTGETTVIVTDQRVGSLSVTKKVENATIGTSSPETPTPDNYQIKITLKDAHNAPLSGTFGGLNFGVNGEATWTAAAGANVKLEDLPIGTAWTVEETEPLNSNNWETTVTSTGGTVTGKVASGKIENTNQNDTVNITNTYDYAATPTKAEAIIKVSKRYDLSNGAQTYGEPVQFTITGIDGTATPNPSSLSITGANSNQFELTFNTAGTYTYTVSEVKGGVNGMTYAETVYTVTFEVERGAGSDCNKLVATPTYTVVEKPSADSNPYLYTDTTGLLFTNTYNPGSSEEQDKGSLSITKTLVKPDNVTTGLPENYEIKITLTKKDHTAYTDLVSYTSDAAQHDTLTFNGGEATYHIQAGETLTLSDLPVGTQWTVTEPAQLDSTYWRTAYKVNGQDATTVSDDISAANETDAVIITNTYDPNGGEIVPGDTGSLSIHKTVGDGIDAGLSFEFSILLTYPNQTTETRTLTVPANGSVTISDLPVGTLYAVTETTTGYTVTATNATGRIPVGGTTAAFHNALTGGEIVPGPGPGPNPGGDDGGTPALNRRDHYAYIIGYPDGNVHPQGNITRAEVATIFFRLLRDPVRTQYWSQTNSYSDVAGDKWYNNAISTLSNMGIICGYPDGTFRPGAPITRAELTKIAASFFADPRVAREYDGRFSDVKGSEWYIAYLMKAIEEALIYGYPDGTFGPNRPITRAETCAIVNRTLGRKPDKDHLLPELVMITWPDNLRPLAWYYAHMQEATNSHDYSWRWQNGEQMENWTGKLRERDWAALERTWSHAHSAPGGEVMQ